MNTGQSVKEVEIVASDGTVLAAHCYHAGRNRYGVALICPAMGVTAKFYTAFANYLSSEGFDVLSFDYSGIGLSRPGSLSGHNATMKTWAEIDIDASLHWVKDNLLAGPLLVVGHSAGGQLVGISKSTVSIDAMLLVCCQSGYWRHWNGFKRVTLFMLWYVFMPLLTRIFRYFPARLLRLGEDLPKGVALQWAKWCRSPSYMASEPKLADRLSRYQGPILSYSFSDDGFAPKNSVDALLDCYSNADIRHIHVQLERQNIASVGHFGFFRERTAKSTLWIDTLDWVKNTIT